MRDILGTLREAKHQAFVLKRAANRAVQPMKRRATLALMSDRPFRWDPAMWPGTDQHGVEPLPWQESTPIPRRIFCFWTGENEMPPARRASFEAMRESQTGVDVILITPENLPAWTVDQAPLHPAYLGLSLVHRSDYLRSYFMHHHGGGYSDIKRPLAGTWAGVFERLDASPKLMGIGYRESAPEFTANPPGEVGNVLQRNYFRVPGNCAFIFRRGSQFTRSWYESTARLLDRLGDEIIAHPGAVWGDTPGYPLAWRQLLGDVMQPWTLVFNDRIGFDDRLLLDFRLDSYR